jgi:hypothetical protein
VVNARPTRGPNRPPHPAPDLQVQRLQQPQPRRPRRHRHPLSTRSSLYAPLQPHSADPCLFPLPLSPHTLQTSGNDVFYRNPFNVEENLFVNVSSPSSSKYTSVADLGSPEEAAQRTQQQVGGLWDAEGGAREQGGRWEGWRAAAGGAPRAVLSAVLPAWLLAAACSCACAAWCCLRCQAAQPLLHLGFPCPALTSSPPPDLHMHRPAPVPPPVPPRSTSRSSCPPAWG